MQFKRIPEGVWEGEPSPLSDFCDFAAKNSNFNATSILLARF